MFPLRAHDYRFLIRRWKRVVSATGLRMREFAASGGHPIYFLESDPVRTAGPAIYISAGIHGDEAASTEGLIVWAESHLPDLRCLRMLIFPCLNPWGLINNVRVDPRGRDLNRCFNRKRVPQIRAQKKVLGKSRFDLALTLHEDFDARGLYLYEIPSIRPYWGEDILRAAASHIQPDPRSQIEGRRAKGGIIRKTITPDLMPEWPEAFVLHFSHAARTFTIETPSECSLANRVAAQAAIIACAVAKCRAEHDAH
jgi:hypothetical protein